MTWRNTDPRPYQRNGKMVACAACGKQRYRSLSQMGAKYCSVACRAVAQRAKRVKDGEARCARCRCWKPIKQFVAGQKGVPQSYCKRCSSVWFHERRGTPADKRRPYRSHGTMTEEEKRQKKRDINKRQHMARRAAGQPPGVHDIGRLFCRQDARCTYCGVLLLATPENKHNKSGYHVDHMTPVSRGGTNDIENLQLLCGKCNLSKGAMTHEEYLVSKRRKVTTWDRAARGASITD